MRFKRSSAVAVCGLIVVGVGVMTTPVQASQPISQSMAACSALYDVVEMSLMSRPDRARARHAAQVWVSYAAQRARDEGRRTTVVDHERQMRRADWVQRGKGFAKTEEFRDWAAYCRALAREYDVPFDPLAKG